jgi:hypothetical protein
MKKYFRSFLSVLLFYIGNNAIAYDWSATSAHVVSIEGTYMPSEILFVVDVSVGSCPSGVFLKWQGHGADAATRQANVKAIYALLVAARLSSTPIRIYGSNSDCLVSFIYLG